MNASSTKKKIYTILILTAILVMPGFLYYLLQEKGKNRYRPLPIFGPKEVARTFHSVRGKQVLDTIYHTLRDFSLTNQNGDTVSLDTWKGKIVIINLLYTQVQSDGTKVVFKALKGFNELYKQNAMVHLASISVDPNDSTPHLADFAKLLGAESKKWDLLGGDTMVVYPLIRKGLLLDVVDVKATTGRKFIYSNKIVLLDTHHRIRGFYEATNHEALSKLDDEIKVLIAEELRNIKDGR